MFKELKLIQNGRIRELESERKWQVMTVKTGKDQEVEDFISHLTEKRCYPQCTVLHFLPCV